MVRFDAPLQPEFPEYEQGSCTTPYPVTLDAGNDRMGVSYYWTYTGETTQKIAMPRPGYLSLELRDQCNQMAFGYAPTIYGRVQLPKPVLYWTGYALRLQPINLGNIEFLVKWYKNGTLFYTGGGPEGEINPLYYSFDPGTYKVVISSPGMDCTDESAPYVQNIEIPRMRPPAVTKPEPAVEQPLGEIKVFPNPGNGRFYLKANHAPVTKTTYTVTDLVGRVMINGVWTDNPQLINLENRPKGIYILKIQSDKLDETVKLIVQ